MTLQIFSFARIAIFCALVLDNYAQNFIINTFVQAVLFSVLPESFSLAKRRNTLKQSLSFREFTFSPNVKQPFK